jgi:hypothetical protein
MGIAKQPSTEGADMNEDIARTMRAKCTLQTMLFERLFAELYAGRPAEFDGLLEWMEQGLIESPRAGMAPEVAEERLERRVDVKIELDKFAVAVRRMLNAPLG